MPELPFSVQAGRGYVVIEPEPEEQTAGGLVLPEVAQRDAHGQDTGVPRVGVGVVVSIGNPVPTTLDEDYFANTYEDAGELLGRRVIYERTAARPVAGDLVIVRHGSVWAELDAGVAFEAPRGIVEV